MFPGRFFPPRFFAARFWPKVGAGAAVVPVPPLAPLGRVADGWTVAGLTVPTAPCGDPTWIEDDQVVLVGSPQFVGWVGNVG